MKSQQNRIELVTRPDEIEVDEIVRSASSREFEEEATPKPALSFTPDC